MVKNQIKNLPENRLKMIDFQIFRFEIFWESIFFFWKLIVFFFFGVKIDSDVFY